MSENIKLQCKDCNDNLTDCTCIEDTVDMKQETLHEVALEFAKDHHEMYETSNLGSMHFGFIEGAKWQQEQGKNKFSEEDLSEAYSQGWMTRERFDDLSPEIVYPKGLDYEEKQEYSFNLWLRKYKQRIV
jgi:vacuolar-type H+-ATPase subunit I/STV1